MEFPVTDRPADKAPGFPPHTAAGLWRDTPTLPTAVVVHQAGKTEFRKRFFPAIQRDDDVEVVLLETIRACRRAENWDSEYRAEHRFVARREFEGLIARIVDARLRPTN